MERKYVSKESKNVHCVEWTLVVSVVCTCFTAITYNIGSFSSVIPDILNSLMFIYPYNMRCTIFRNMHFQANRQNASFEHFCWSTLVKWIFIYIMLQFFYSNFFLFSVYWTRLYRFRFFRPKAQFILSRTSRSEGRLLAFSNQFTQRITTFYPIFAIFRDMFN